MPIFTWKLMDKQYDDCLDIVAEISDNLDPEIIEMLKCGILNRMFEDNDVRLFFSNPPEVTIDEAISLMKKYFDSGVDSGEIHGVRYGIF